MQFAAIAPSLDLTSLSGSGRREFRHVLSSNDQQLVGLSVDLGAKGLGPGADVDRVLDRMEQVLEAAKGLSGGGLPLTVACEVGPLPTPARSERPKPKVTGEMAGLIILPGGSQTGSGVGGQGSRGEEADRSRGSTPDPAFVSQVDAALAELGRRADRYGVPLALRSELASYAALERALRAADCPWFGVDFDPAAVLRDEWDVDEVLSRMGGGVRHVRGRDAVAGADRRTKPATIGQGSTNWGGLLARLDEAGYHGWITIDPVDLPDRVAAAAAARGHVTQAAKA